jgi:hypothetical protein
MRSKMNTIWHGIMNRCHNKNQKYFKHYGGRGIGVCERWLNFNNFLADMGECPDGRSIDRIDNDKGYSPENCRWATRSEQSRNTRLVTKVEIHGIVKSLKDWTEEFGLNHNTVVSRITRGTPILRAITFVERGQKYRARRRLFLPK